jgi:hypothetical protein
MLQFTSQSDFSEIYRIMQASFSDNEYRPYDEQLALFEEPEYRIYYMPAIGMERVGNHWCKDCLSTIRFYIILKLVKLLCIVAE